MQWCKHICSAMYVRNAKCMYTSALGHIRYVYWHNSHISVYELIGIYSISLIFVGHICMWHIFCSSMVYWFLMDMCNNMWIICRLQWKCSGTYMSNEADIFVQGNIAEMWNVYIPVYILILFSHICVWTDLHMWCIYGIWRAYLLAHYNTYGNSMVKKSKLHFVNWLIWPKWPIQNWYLSCGIIIIIIIIVLCHQCYHCFLCSWSHG